MVMGMAMVMVVMMVMVMVVVLVKYCDGEASFGVLFSLSMPY
jgi:hypothetical protein